jgi:lipopolysaccharide export system protein LptA
MSGLSFLAWVQSRSKIRALMKQHYASLTLAVALALAAVPAVADKADRNKPMNVEADSLRYDDVHQTSVFTGKVVVSKGSIVIRGAKMTVKQDPEGYQFGVVTGDAGQRAFFRQKREGAEEFIEGESETIEYDGRADRVKFINRAEMRRLRGTTISDETSGALITYDNTTDVYTVDGAAGGATAANPGGRVRATLGPRPATPSTNSATPAAPAASAARLRPSTSMRGEAR